MNYKVQPKFIAFESVMPERRHTHITVPQCDEEASPCNSDPWPMILIKILVACREINWRGVEVAYSAAVGAWLGLDSEQRESELENHSLLMTLHITLHRKVKEDCCRQQTVTVLTTTSKRSNSHLFKRDQRTELLVASEHLPSHFDF